MTNQFTFAHHALRRLNFQSLERIGPCVSTHWKLASAFACWMLGASLSASAVVLASETFDTSSSGWIDRDPGKMTVTYAAGFGNAAGSLKGSFASQALPSFQSDAFRAGAASSSGQFSGNLYLSYANFSDFSFNFYAENVLPSTLILRIGDGTNTFLYNLNSQLTTTSTWMNVDASLTYSAGWIGGSAAQFSNTLSSVSFVDVQISRNGTGLQYYFLDNFYLNSVVESLTSVPEPASFGLILAGLFTLYLVRKRKRVGASAVRNEKR